MTNKTLDRRAPSYNESLLVIGISMLIMIIGTVALKLKPEILLTILAMFAAIMGSRLGYTWNEMEEAIAERLKVSMPVLLMIWTIGMVVGTFIFAGSIPMLIYYGLKIINPSLVAFSAFITCMIFSTATGSSWSSAGTAGVAFMGVAAGLGASLPMTAGAVIAGAIFGDKLSPLSETTNLAALTADTDLYAHIKSMLWTTLPPAILAGIVYLIFGRVSGASGLPTSTVAMIDGLGNMFNFNIILIIPFLIIIFSALTKKPTVPALFISSLSAMALGVFYQGFPLKVGFESAVSGFKTASVYAGELPEAVVSIVNRGGMTSMVGVILIIFCGYCFAAIISKTGHLDTVITPITDKVKTPAQLIIATLLTVFLIMLSTGNAYVAYILVPEMFRKKYAELKISSMVLSRSLEDIGTVTGALIPWTGSVLFYTANLGVAPWGAGGYALWSFIPYLSPLFAIIWAVTGIGVYKLTDKESQEALTRIEEMV